MPHTKSDAPHLLHKDEWWDQDFGARFGTSWFVKKARDSLFVLGTANGGSGDEQMFCKLQQAALH